MVYSQEAKQFSFFLSRLEISVELLKDLVAVNFTGLQVK